MYPIPPTDPTDALVSPRDTTHKREAAHTTHAGLCTGSGGKAPAGNYLGLGIMAGLEQPGADLVLKTALTFAHQ